MEIALTRSDFIGEYVGTTAIKTQKLILKSKSQGVKIINILNPETLLYNSRDHYGYECIDFR